MIDCSIIIVNYKVKHFVEQSIDAVKQSNLEGYSIEIIVVDNDSQDESESYVQQFHSNIQWIQSPKNIGFSAANNLGFKAAKGRYVLLLNPDTIVSNTTLARCISYMDKHQETGGLGIKMIDGSGHFLPESKRGLPTPWVAFYKIFGLSSIFPRSKKLGRYHLNYLSKEENQEVDVLSGAFLMMPQQVQMQLGGLDETFFMYGEDIDLSYRIQQLGKKNIYFADDTILHFKGESTKKGSLNYVFVFYNAMIIFAKKHFTGGKTPVYSLMIRAAIVVRAFLSILKRIVSKLILPFADLSIILLLFYGAMRYWEANHLYVVGQVYPSFLLQWMLPTYSVFWLSGLLFSKTYSKRRKLSSSLLGVFWGTISLLVFYAILPEQLRTSRALILLTSAGLGIWIFLSRSLLSSLGRLSSQDHSVQRICLLGNRISPQEISPYIQGGISESTFFSYPSTFFKESHWKDFLSSLHIDQVIIDKEDLSYSDIIACFQATEGSNSRISIFHREKSYVIGSSSTQTQGSVVEYPLSHVFHPSKLDLLFATERLIALVFILGSPILWVLSKKKSEFLSHILGVFFQKSPWISLPKIHRKGKISLNFSEPYALEKRQIWLREYTTRNVWKYIWNVYFKGKVE